MARLSPPAALVKFLKPYDRAIQNLALSLRSLVLEEMGPCHENIYDAYNAVAIGYGPTDRLKDGIFHIAVYSNHVNLGFNHGAALDDALGILKGTGKQIRHITVKTKEDLARPELRSYIRLALKVALDDARKLGEPWTTNPAAPRKTKGLNRSDLRKNASVNPSGVISVVKAVYPKKRRPGGKS